MMPASGPELNTPMTICHAAFGGRPDMALAGLDFRVRYTADILASRKELISARGRKDRMLAA